MLSLISRDAGVRVTVQGGHDGSPRSRLQKGRTIIHSSYHVYTKHCPIWPQNGGIKPFPNEYVTVKRGIQTWRRTMWRRVTVPYPSTMAVWEQIHFNRASHDISVGIMIMPPTGRSRNRGSVPGRPKRFYSLQTLQTRPTQPSLEWARKIRHWGKSAEKWIWPLTST